MNLSVANVLVMGIGSILVYSGVKDVHPVQLIKDALQGRVTPAGSWGNPAPTNEEDLTSRGYKKKKTKPLEGDTTPSPIDNLPGVEIWEDQTPGTAEDLLGFDPLGPFGWDPSEYGPTTSGKNTAGGGSSQW